MSLSQFHTVLFDKQQAIKLGLFIAVIVFLLFFFFQPFGNVKHGFTLEGIMRILSYSLGSSAAFLILEYRVKPKTLTHSKYSIAWYILIFITIAFIVFLIKNSWGNFSYWSLNDFFLVAYRVFVIAVFLLTTLYLYTRFSSATSSMRSSNQLLLQSKDVNPDILQLPPHSIKFIKSEGNYATVYYLTATGHKTKLLRGSLSYFKKQLPPEFVQINRAYIINITNVAEVSGNSQGLSVALDDVTHPLKVTRTYKDDFQNALNFLHQKHHSSQH